MNGTALTLVAIVLLSLAGGFFLLGELEDKYKDQEKEEDDDKA